MATRIKSIKLTHGRVPMAVAGRGVFPFGMLAQDQATPAAPEDGYRTIMQTAGRVIFLWRYTTNGADSSAEAWASFGWHVLTDTEREIYAARHSYAELANLMTSRGCKL